MLLSVQRHPKDVRFSRKNLYKNPFDQRRKEERESFTDSLSKKKKNKKNLTEKMLSSRKVS